MLSGAWERQILVGLPSVGLCASFEPAAEVKGTALVPVNCSFQHTEEAMAIVERGVGSTRELPSQLLQATSLKHHFKSRD